VYPGSYRHQGLLLVFLITLYWIASDASPPVPRWRFLARLARVGRHGCLPALLVISLSTGIYKVVMDVGYEMSASRAFGAYLDAHPEHQDAILISEPDFYIESLPYYAHNRIYIVREQRFGDTVKFTRRAELHLDLGELLRAAWRIHVGQNKEVLIALGHLKDFDPLADGGEASKSLSYGYGRTLSWTGEDLRVWKASTKLIARFADDVIGDERYAVYKLVASPL